MPAEETIRPHGASSELVSVSAPTSAPARKDKKEKSHFDGLKTIPDPPNLQTWREKLFNVQGTLTLSEEE